VSCCWEMNDDTSHESRRLVKAMLVRVPAGHLLKGLGTKLGIRCSALLIDHSSHQKHSGHTNHAFGSVSL